MGFAVIRAHCSYGTDVLKTFQSDLGLKSNTAENLMNCWIIINIFFSISTHQSYFWRVPNNCVRVYSTDAFVCMFACIKRMRVWKKQFKSCKSTTTALKSKAKDSPLDLTSRSQTGTRLRTKTDQTPRSHSPGKKPRLRTSRRQRRGIDFTL